MSIGREWTNAIQNTSKLLQALARGLEIPTVGIGNKSSATSINVHQTSAVPAISDSRLIAYMEWKKVRPT